MLIKLFLLKKSVGSGMERSGERGWVVERGKMPICFYILRGKRGISRYEKRGRVSKGCYKQYYWLCRRVMRTLP
jgi:hypothetical protein